MYLEINGPILLIRPFGVHEGAEASCFCADLTVESDWSDISVATVNV